MKKSIIGLLACVALSAVATPPVSAQDGPQVFTRTGSWVLDAGEESCQLARVFTSGDEQISLALERNRADNVARMVLVGNAVRTYRAAEEVGYRYLPDGEGRTARYIRSETPDGQAYFNFGSVFIGPDPMAGPPAAAPASPGAEFVVPPYDRAAELEFAAGITAIEFREGLVAPIRLETGSLRGAMEALQACTDDLLLTWGLDWEKHRAMTRRAAPVGPASEWIPAGVVGFEDFAAFAGARNPFRVMIDAEGKPTSCQPHWVSLTERQNQRICAGIMENGSFTPALDAAGQPMASYWMVDYMFGLSQPFGR